MAAICPNEGKQLLIEQCIKQITTNRGTNLTLGLFTGPATINSGTTFANITQPTATNGYAAKTLTDDSWTTSGTTTATETYAAQTFTATGTWSGNVYGYFIATKGPSPKLLSIELLTGGPYSVVNTDAITVTPVINLS